ncbi:MULTISPECIES: twin-arginine translocase TatA/TatE family subunit [unclassified Mucilaginibacter]|uniref:twin-arginine translocase TatA/TatE family subunit n=1 Tax=unclassified Mucilaginibacter TaxID=2617802 RepID=UPI000961F64D|nr:MULTISPECIES: twin-arginine translocase TatA/TatE family subunit [unclassified Mucilaginibacter]HEK19720.1 twin-arginine translocase TatA/TatE family subunit [Bacteroidota bacterium]OJW17630.1 MAG: Sec-independent protein translocase TatA [Mucilaginibacter sp. 44-25]PAW92979.1 twin-arginine translocase TatA/TatE family subunit [Mucilaginibacter sp. MD40]PLW90229.1 MAG: twin-arginine translocase TatA/TatE family subunit [Mucilaginibacter sp.]PMP64726.1 MAG: twin-arginine translocase TatA/Tat
MGLGAPEIILIIIAILLLFGGKKVPELMRGLGKGVKEFKDAQNGESSSSSANTSSTEDKPKV